MHKAQSIFVQDSLKTLKGFCLGVTRCWESPPKDSYW